jgi:hypothetical protein
MNRCGWNRNGWNRNGWAKWLIGGAAAGLVGVALGQVYQVQTNITDSQGNTVAAEKFQFTIPGPATQPAGSVSSPSVSPLPIANPVGPPTPAATPVPISNPSGTSPLAATITLTSPSGIYPLEPVHAEALEGKFGNVSPASATIQWDFGDAGAKYDDLVGFNAAHAYASAGTYTIALNVSAGGQSTAATQQVTVAPDNRPTVNIASGTPAGFFSSNTRYLFQAGGTWTFSRGTLIDLSGLQHVYIGSYGSGPAPVFNYSGPQDTPDTIRMSATTQGVVIQGIKFDSKYAGAGANASLPTASSPCGNDIAFIGCTFGNLGDDLNLNHQPKNVLVQDCASPGQNSLSGYFAWVQGTDIVFLGNSCAGSMGQAVFRVGGVSDSDALRILSAFNNYSQYQQMGNAYKNCLTIQWSKNFYSWHDTISTGPAQLGPIGDTGANTSASTQNAVIDSMKFSNTQVIISPQTLGSLIRNCVCLQSPQSVYNSAFSINSTQSDGGFNWKVDGLSIVGNTFDTTAKQASFLQVQQGEPANVSVTGNLMVCPNMVMGQYGNMYVMVSNPDTTGLTFSGNIYGAFKPPENSYWNGGMFYVNPQPQLPAGCLTPAQWNSTGGNSNEQANVPVTLNAGNYTATVDGVTAGSALPQN